MGHDVSKPMRSRLTDLFRLLVSVVVLGIFAFAAWKIGLFEPSGAKKVSMLTGHAGGTWLVVTFIVVYASIAALSLPVHPLAYGAGALFGFVRGAIFIWVASIAGAASGYVLARYVWASMARRLLGSQKEKLKDLGKGNPALTAFRMQLMPLIPFGVFNYAAAIAKMPLAQFLIGTAFGIIPGTLLSAYIGDRVIAGVHGKDRTPLYFAVGAGLVLLALSFLPNLIKKLRKRR
jgi:uncharacterized membrane protein YdjX (TVP38/TMEM64 family)